MLSEKMKALGVKKSVIREIFEYAKVRKAQIGAENVFDYSIGNPSVPSPESVKETLISLISEREPTQLHGYTSAQGDLGVRKAIADYLNKTYEADASEDLIYLTVGAAAALTISLNAVLADDANEEVIVFAPFFPEYKVFIEKAGGKIRPVPCAEPDFQIDFDAFEKSLTTKTKAVIVNSPNNPTGVVLSESTILRLAEIMRKAEETFGHPIYLIADEPYRELVYNGVEVPYLTRYYDNTIVCYSFSKALSLPGERIGYILVSSKAADAKSVYAAVLGAGRALGFVCAPSLFQYMIPSCLGKTSDISVYDKNRKLLYDSLTEYGYTCASPDGAFYLFVKALESDAYAFCERAKKYELLLVPSDDFGFPGYVRIAYCVTTEQIQRSLPAFEALANDYKANI
ncbi:MAG: pyridoxal phosphate-dependent aminotransferase [Clostridia bacterium]|nr:pyridoxal phosphate-dependent aminotransferase [Clostridia bacterium]